MLYNLFTQGQIDYLVLLNNDSEKTRREKLETLYDYVYNVIQICEDDENNEDNEDNEDALPF